MHPYTKTALRLSVTAPPARSGSARSTATSNEEQALLFGIEPTDAPDASAAPPPDGGGAEIMERVQDG